MIEYIEKTGLSFEPGEKLKATDLSKLNNTINSLVDAVNSLLRGEFNVNLEINDFNTKFDLERALDIVSDSRRERGLKIRFLNESGKYVEYSYLGEHLTDDDWFNVENWKLINKPDLIDGGEW